MSEPEITVIIPTRERCDVLEESLQTVTAQNYDNLDIIVSDNFSTGDTEDVDRSANDARIKYINTGQIIARSCLLDPGQSE
jgi:glycosyltransferase involved in cell wall biosynthesis